MVTVLAAVGGCGELGAGELGPCEPGADAVRLPEPCALESFTIPGFDESDAESRVARDVRSVAAVVTDDSPAEDFEETASARAAPTAVRGFGERGADTVRVPEPCEWELFAIPGFDESDTVSRVARDVRSVAGLESDDSPADDFEEPESAVSACAVPPVATAVPIPNATASAPIRPIRQALDVGTVSAFLETRGRSGLDAHSSDDILDPPIN